MQDNNKQITKPKAAEWINKPEFGTSTAMRIFAWLSLLLGRRITRLFLYPPCLYFFLCLKNQKVASKKYLAKVLNRKPTARDIFRHFHTFSAVLLDRVYILNDQYSKFDIKIHGLDIVDGMMEKGNGCLLLGTHLGSFDIMRAVGQNTRDINISLVMYEENARKVNSVLAAINPNKFPRIIALGKFDSMLKVKSALEAGEFVGVLGDRTIEESGDVTCSFLNEKASFPLGPFRLATMLRCPIIIMFGIYRGGNRYEIFFEHLADMSKVDRDKRQAVMEETLKAYVARIEHYCRIAPYNWFNFYDFWK